MNLFYTPNIDSSLILSEEESIHCIRVLRLNKGDEIHIFDGKGSLYKAIIDIPHPKKCQVKGLQLITKEKIKKSHLHIAIAPPKNIELLEWFLEKATEIGISEISLILSQFSERKKVNLKRLEKIIISA